MKERVVLHADCNSFFASVECKKRPELKEVPMAVAGDPESRHGIILAKNEKAKKFGVKTAETIWQARQKCPELVLVPPCYEDYTACSKQVNAIYQQYTDLCEPFGIDETFLDVTGSMHLFNKDGEGIAQELRERVKKEVGITISVGVSFNKVFAKLGSDYKKPDAVTVISRQNFREIVYPLAAGDMLNVGPKAEARLNAFGIYTIGQLGAARKDFLQSLFGKAGESMWRAANGLDDDPVHSIAEESIAKSVGQGVTFPRNLMGAHEISLGISMLAEKVAERLRNRELVCTGVQISIRDPQFKNISRQKALREPSCLYAEIYALAWELAQANWNMNQPVRAISVTALGIGRKGEIPVQGSLFADEKEHTRAEQLEQAVFTLRKKYGRQSIGRAGVMSADFSHGKGNNRNDKGSYIPFHGIEE